MMREWLYTGVGSIGLVIVVGLILAYFSHRQTTHILERQRQILRQQQETLAHMRVKRRS